MEVSRSPTMMKRPTPTIHAWVDYTLMRIAALSILPATRLSEETTDLAGNFDQVKKPSLYNPSIALRTKKAHAFAERPPQLTNADQLICY